MKLQRFIISNQRALVVVPLTLLLLWFVAAVTVEGVFARSRPDLALAFRGVSADANARLAGAGFGDKMSPETLSSARARAEAALAREPVNVAAARTLGIVAGASNDLPKADRLMAYAQTLSRRDVATQLFLIETAVRRDDINQALVHYDRALRTSNRSHELLFPVLMSAANEEVVRGPLMRLLAQRPPWWRPFLQRLSDSGSNARTLYLLSRSVGLERIEPEERWRLQIAIRRLVDLKDYAAAQDLFSRAQSDPAVRRLLVQDGHFEGGSGLEPFDWSLHDEPDLSAVRQQREQQGAGNALYLTAQNGRGGDVASQLLVLRPGTYRFAALVGSVGSDPASAPQLIIKCASGPIEYVRKPFPAAPDGGRRWEQSFTVPGDCPAQSLGLRLSSSEGVASQSPWIDAISITRQ